MIREEHQKKSYTTGVWSENKTYALLVFSKAHNDHIVCGYLNSISDLMLDHDIEWEVEEDKEYPPLDLIQKDFWTHKLSFHWNVAQILNKFKENRQQSV